MTTARKEKVTRRRRRKMLRIEEQKSGRESFWMAGAICDIQPSSSHRLLCRESPDSSSFSSRRKSRQHFLENNDPVRDTRSWAYPPSPFSTPVSRPKASLVT